MLTVYLHSDDNGESNYYVDKKQKQPEELVILFTYAGRQPRTMVVIFEYTLITLFTVSAAYRLLKSYHVIVTYLVNRIISCNRNIS